MEAVIKMHRRIIQFATKLMVDSGIDLLKNPNPYNPGWKLLSICSLFMSAIISTSMVSITNTDDFYTFVNPSPYVAAATVLQGGVYYMYHYKNLIADMFNEIDLNLYTYPDEHLLQVEYPWYMEEGNFIVLVIFIKYFMFFLLFLICTPVFGELAYYRRIKTFIYPSWMPWKVDSLKAELFKFVLQFSQGVCGVWFTYMIMVFQLITIIEFIRQYKRLMTAVSTLKWRTSMLQLQKIQNQEGFYDLIMRENIIHCIKHHQILHKNFHPFKVWFSAFFSLELTVSVVTFAFALYVMINTSSLGQVLNYFIVVSFIWTNLLIRCFVSEIFSSLNYNLSETLLWDVEWYQTSRENRRLLLIFHQMSCRPLRLFGISVFEATRITFTNLVRVTYSIFNVLNLSMK